MGKMGQRHNTTVATVQVPNSSQGNVSPGDPLRLQDPVEPSGRGRAQIWQDSDPQEQGRQICRGGGDTSRLGLSSGRVLASKYIRRPSTVCTPAPWRFTVRYIGAPATWNGVAQVGGCLYPTSVTYGKCSQYPSSRLQPFLLPQPHSTAPTCVQCAPTRPATCSTGSYTGASPDSYACGGHILLLSTPHPIPAWTTECVCQQRPLLCATSDTISASTDSPWYPSRSAQVRPTTCILGSLCGDFNLSSLLMASSVALTGHRTAQASLLVS